MFDAIDDSDMMLHFPYHSYNYILQFFNQAAIDPYVKEIKITFYRMASNSFIGDALISAATNGKKVTVFIELKARFDEANNLVWAERMQDAGIKVIYSIPGLKVHAKIALVKKQMDDGSIRHYSFFGTGNMNESTAKIYSDFGLLTSHTEMGEELNSVFKYLYKKKTPKSLDNILVNQFNMVDRFVEMIDQEIANAKAGKKARIVIKLNNLQETAMIDKLYEASCTGVKVEMIVRSICCLIPGIDGLSENITIRRIVDRYLEHARIFLFHNDGEEKIFMGSADWMSRNLKNRIEVTFPIYDESLKKLVSNILNLQLTDNVKAVELNNQMENIPVNAGKNKPVRAQTESYDYIKSL
jgi:polyphosphate kinase